MSASDALALATELCVAFEGFKAAPYICPAGYPTSGYGTVWKPDGTKVTMDDPHIDAHTAAAWLKIELEGVCLPGVLKASPGLIAHPEKLGALLDFTYNLGVARYRASTLRARVNEGRWVEAADELPKWRMGGGRVLPGLVRRREAERALFLSGG
jgi:lysozyme